MTDLQKRLFSAFDSEYRSILESIRAHVSRVESTGEKLAGPPLDEAFRMAHTLKGSAHVVGFPVIVKLAHRLESLFAQVRDARLQLGLPEIRLIHSVLDAIEDIVAAFHDGKEAPDVQAMLDSIETVLGLKSPQVQAPQPLVSPQPLKLVESAPPVVSESETVRLSAAHLDQLLGTAGELLSVLRGSHEVDAKITVLSGHIDSISREWNLLRRSSAGVIQKMNQLPEFARVAQFLEFLGTELAPLTKKVHAAREASKQSEWDLRHLSEQLQDDVRKARLVTAETVFGGFNKMVRDLSGELGRKIDFRFAGLDVEADRLVLQALKDPIMHMLRNSIGHGIETREIREQCGKDPIGKMNVRIQATGGRLMISIEDDGRGLDEGKIRERAISSGILKEGETATLDKSSLYDLIFRPGFSTASEISDLSWRGMGMSVATETIKRLQGTIKIESEMGRSLKFTISVPIALANHRLILTEYAGQPYAIPCGNIESLRRVKREDLKTFEGQLSILVNERPVRVLSLGSALGLPDSSLGNSLLSLVVLQSGGRFLAIAVDTVSDECESIIKNLGTAFKKQKLFSGAILRGDGHLALVLDPHALLEGAQSKVSSGGGVTRASVIPAVKQRDLRVLVVDDSITTRTLEKGILEAHGYHVTLAVDGLDALTKLQVDTFDLVISDVEMPRMDGFTLVSEIRKHPKVSKIPLIMVTSLEKPEDKARGLALGADAYVMKQKFNQGDLLQTIKQVAMKPVA